MVPASSSILSELQRTVSDRTSVSLGGRGVAPGGSGADFILAPVVGGGTLRPLDLLRRRDLCEAAAGDSGGVSAAGSEGGAESATVELEYKSLWDQFAALGTEMVITKSGRSVSRQAVLYFP